jgi:Na+-driven multidrug efflux pump
MRIAYPAALEQLVSQAGFIGFLVLIGHFYGADAFAAYNVGVNMLNAAMVVGFGFAIAGSTLVGQNLGAGDPQAAARAGWRACGLGVLAMTLIGLVVVINARPLAHFFLETGGPVVERTVEFTYIMAAMLPLLGVENGIGGSLRGAGDTRFPLLTSFLGLVGTRCGLAALFCVLRLPVIWVYSAIIGDYLLRGSLLIWRFKSGRWINVLGRVGPT